jgi:3-hydroxyisobutyrate dehydrogenase-like beta-hydroxyacid dehydrogenase
MSAANADRIGLIGLGLMGGALAHRLIGAGYSVLGHDIDADKTRLVPGLEAAASVDEISKRCRRVVLAVYDTGQVESVVAELEAARRPVLLLCATTVEPRRIALLAARAARYGITLIEAPITGTSAEIEAGRGVGLLAGPKESVTLATDLLEVFCPQWFHMGSLGSAAKAALAINLVMQLNRAALAEGLVFAERLGLSPAAFLEALRSSPAGSQVMAVKGEKMVRREYSPQLPVTHTLATQSLKDAQFILETAHRLGQHLPMMEVNAALLAATIAQGGMRRDSAAVIEAIRTSRPKTD